MAIVIPPSTLFFQHSPQNTLYHSPQPRISDTPTHMVFPLLPMPYLPFLILICLYVLNLALLIGILSLNICFFPTLNIITYFMFQIFYSVMLHLNGQQRAFI